MNCDEILVYSEKWWPEKKCAHRLSGTLLVAIHNVVISMPSFMPRVVHASMAYVGVVTQSKVCNGMTAEMHGL